MKDKDFKISSITVLGLDKSYSMYINGGKPIIMPTKLDTDLVIAEKDTMEKILGRSLGSYDDILTSAQDFLKSGAKSLLLTKIESGLESTLEHDYWMSREGSFWLSHASVGEVLGTPDLWFLAIVFCLGKGYDIKDAIVIAKMFVNRSSEQSANKSTIALELELWPEEEKYIPYLSHEPLLQRPKPFIRFKPGLYPIVDSSQWVNRLLQQGIRCLQLRIKNASSQAFLEKEIQSAVLMAKQQGATLFINDYWKEALNAGATAIHLGQEDLAEAPIETMREKGVLLGISTHGYYEVARAHALNPSYIANGSIFATNSKDMSTNPQGILQLQRLRRTLDYPLVAIGGITLENLPQVLISKVDGISVISAITLAEDPDKAIQQWIKQTRHL